MKKILLTFCLALLSFGSIHAGKAWPHPITVVQSDGTPITVFLHGDEHFHWYTDTEGHILQRNGNDFTILNVDEDTFLAQATEVMQSKAVSYETITKTTSLFPHTGTPRAVVILAEYSDLKFSLPNPRKSFEQYLNSTDGQPTDFGFREDLNYGSVKQYFISQSDSTFMPQFDLYGPVTLPNNMSYYGGTDDNGNDEQYTQLLIDACNAMNDSLDFSQYDQDGDGNIDLVYVIYAGYGQSSGAPNNTMWPKSFSGFTSVKFDGKGVNRGGISNELMAYEGAFGYNTTETNTTKNFDTAVKRINGIGLFIHEFSHCLGLPDFYPTKLSTYYDNQGMEDWSIMDNGEYVSNGNVPTAYTAWERECFGWDNIPTISTAGQYQLTAQKGKRAVKVVNPSNSNEYYVFEIFEDTGWNQKFARYVSSSENINYDPSTKGLLVYHVDYSASDFSLSSNNVNNVVGHPKMTIIPADGTLTSSYRIGSTISYLDYNKQLNGDIFRVDSAYTDSTFSQTNGLVNAAWWTSADATPLYNINYTNGAVYFDFLTHVATTGISQPDVTTLPSTSDRIYTLDGRFVGTSVDALPHGIYIRGGKKFVK
ncbi:MAG: M6 family metalloprotease domain-containing protein [Prevotella sp.]|nr:M6 family metalloprotease domain-containing protein [Prevotella sp.]